jgi:hypothetical protein
MSSTEEVAAAIAIAFITRRQRRRRNRTQWENDGYQEHIIMEHVLLL